MILTVNINCVLDTASIYCQYNARIL